MFSYLIIFLATFSLAHSNPGIDEEKYLNFLSAIQNNSTNNYFAVITVKDLNSGRVKEICSKGNFISGAVYRELKLDYDSISDKKVYDYFKLKTTRYFEFRSKAALKNINFYNYNENLIKQIASEFPIETICKQIDVSGQYFVEIEGKRMKALAHVLFNRGYMTGESSCEGGRLLFVKRK